jgi:hypothetical protein
MRVAIWDTYVRRTDGQVMHFDIIVGDDVKDESIVFSYGEQYLISKNQAGQIISAKECRFCHTEIASEELAAKIAQKGYYILEMENC